MTITLYKNCCLNNKYQEVFYHTKLETYLNTLNKYTLNLDTSYYENDMELVIDYTWFQNEGGVLVSKNIYDYNYCKITETFGISLEPNLVRYCFIKSINVKNGCVYLELEEDIWASFSSKIQGTNPCILSNSRRKTYGQNTTLSLLSLPYNYDSNNKLDITSLSYTGNSIDVYMLVEFQLYDINSYEEPNADRDVFYAIVKTLTFPETFNILEQNARKLMANMSSKTIRGKNYQVGNIYAIPNGLLSISDFDAQDENLFDGLVMREAIGSIEHIILTGSITNNYKNLFIGALDNYIKLVNNGTSIDYQITFSCCDAGVSLKLNCSNQIIDLTNSFKYDVPFQGILSEEFAARSVANSLKENKIYLQKDATQIDAVMSIGSAMFSGLGSVFAEGNSGVFGNANSMLLNIKNAVQKWGGIGDEQKILDSEMWAVKAPKYCNSKGIINNLSTLTNIAYGLCIGKISPDNNSFVKTFVDNFGYNSYLFLDNTLLSEILKTDLYVQNSFHYNAIRFTSPSLYGNFTNEIANKLNSILSNGVKIWYDSTKTLDSYTNDLLS